MYFECSEKDKDEDKGVWLKQCPVETEMEAMKPSPS